jgi:hypothetical protein
MMNPPLWVTNKMKTLKVRFGIALMAMASTFASTSGAKAADLELRGYASVNESRFESYSGFGAVQNGRYSNLGAGYYRRTTVGVDGIRNYSSFNSGSISMELWAMPYYGATSGTVLMTTNAGTVFRRSTKLNVYRTGNKMAYDGFAFPEVNIWEFTRSGWGFRDNIAFTRNRWM